MPQILAPRRDSLGRSAASLAGSRSSLRRCSSRRSSLGSAAGHPSYGSQFSLRRLVDEDKAAAQPRRASLGMPDCDPTAKYGAKRNEEWTFVLPGATTPPSLVSSETSVNTNASSSSGKSSASQSSLHKALSRPPSSNAVKALHRYYALRRASLQAGAPLPSSLGLSPKSPRRAGPPRRASLGPLPQHPLQPTNRAAASSAASFFPRGLKEGEVWGQFVDTQDAEEDLVRRSKVLSLSRRLHVASLSQGGLR